MKEWYSRRASYPKIDGGLAGHCCCRCSRGAAEGGCKSRGCKLGWRRRPRDPGCKGGCRRQLTRFEVAIKAFEVGLDVKMPIEIPGGVCRIRSCIGGCPRWLHDCTAQMRLSEVVEDLKLQMKLSDVVIGSDVDMKCVVICCRIWGCNGLVLAVSSVGCNGVRRTWSYVKSNPVSWDYDKASSLRLRL